MNKIIYIIFLGIIFFINSSIYGQSNDNCFFNDFELKTAEIPQSVNMEKPTEPSTVTVIIKGDTLGKISKYIFGNAIAAWAGAHDNLTLLENTKLLAPTLIRFPGGSWSDGYFWNGLPSDLPDSIPDGTKYNGSTAPKIKFWGETGKGGWQTTTDQYYSFRNKIGTQGLITINYAYARYGLSSSPVSQAAHLAADWVRYDNGRTKFWEIGNENGGPWEYGWMIDTSLNKDGQPQIISGELYGKHFKVFADSMRSAAKEIGAEIYIGGQVLHFDGTNSWNFVDKTWNDGFFKEAGNSADFYVIHNYFSTSTNVKDILNLAVTEPKKNMDFIKQDILNKKAYSKPVALTEYNIGSGSLERGVSYINGMQAVILFNELIKNNYSMSCRWLLVTGEGALFYAGSESNYLYHPRPEFYYTVYLQKFTGDHSISTNSSNTDILCYATKFSSGETGIVVVNKADAEQVITIDTKSIGVGKNYYIYSLTGGTDHDPFSQNVYVNGSGPSLYQWGPFDNLLSIPANKYPIGNEIKFTSTARSVQMILVEGGNNYLHVDDKEKTEMIHSYNLYQNYPNPFNPITTIKFSIPERSFVSLKVFNLLGEEIKTLINEIKQKGTYSVIFNAGSLPSGIYIYTLRGNNSLISRKLILLK